MKIDIFVKDTENELEKLGLDSEQKWHLTVLHVGLDDIRGLWIDPDVDKETNMRTMIIYALNDNFRCPYNSIIAETIINEIERRDVRE